MMFFFSILKKIFKYDRQFSWTGFNLLILNLKSEWNLSSLLALKNKLIKMNFIKVTIGSNCFISNMVKSDQINCSRQYTSRKLYQCLVNFTWLQKWVFFNTKWNNISCWDVKQKRTMMKIYSNKYKTNNKIFPHWIFQSWSSVFFLWFPIFLHISKSAILFCSLYAMHFPVDQRILMHSPDIVCSVMHDV